MQEAALEGVDPHDGFGLVAEAFLHHQVGHILLLDVDVAALRAVCQTHKHFSREQCSAACKHPSPAALSMQTQYSFACLMPSHYLRKH